MHGFDWIKSLIIKDKIATSPPYTPWTISSYPPPNTILDKMSKTQSVGLTPSIEVLLATPYQLAFHLSIENQKIQ